MKEKHTLVQRQENAMTYRKIYVPQNTAVNREKIIPEKIIPEIVHRPEIVTEKAAAIPMYKKERCCMQLPFVKIICAAVLCSVSFAAGCAVTNDRLAHIVEAISLVSAGKTEAVSKKTQSGDDSEQLTFYEKYMPPEYMSEPNAAVEYISASFGEAPPSYENEQTEKETADIKKDDAMAVVSSSSGKTGYDGELLYAVMSHDMSAGGVYTLNNQTRFKPDTYSLATKTPAALENLSINHGEPLVLIVHTHGTESYNSYSDENYVSASDTARSPDTEKNVVAVGDKVTAVLEDFGIPVIHSRKMCDSESFVNAYSTSYAEVKGYLEKYPSIRFVIDLHRDAIELADGSRKKPVFESFGEKSAQLMFVVGTNAAGANHPDWQENLSLALVVQNEISKDYPQLFRSINLRTASFNQQLSSGYMLLECGSAANTLKEAENAAELFATGFARVILSYAKE